MGIRGWKTEKGTSLNESDVRKLLVLSILRKKKNSWDSRTWFWKFEVDNLKPQYKSSILNCIIRAVRLVFRGDDRGFSEWGSQNQSNGPKVSSQLANFFFLSTSTVNAGHPSLFQILYFFFCRSSLSITLLVYRETAFINQGTIVRVLLQVRYCTWRRPSLGTLRGSAWRRTAMPASFAPTRRSLALCAALWVVVSVLGTWDSVSTNLSLERWPTNDWGSG